MIATRFNGRGTLLAVCALAAAPAVVSVARAASEPAPRVIVIVVPQPTPVLIEMARPRVMPTGAPACGNVAVRALPGDPSRSCP